ncbi:MAG: hypothetical protein NT150_00345, partial [Bacteroidetes bacterium]|nr:hypothetical protein [Bacteroidota bacterium]
MVNCKKLKKVFSLALFLLLVNLLSAQTYYKLDSVHYTHNKLDSAQSKILYIRDSLSSGTCIETVSDAYLFARFSYGSLYTFGDKNITATVNFTIKGYNAFSGGTEVFSKSSAMTINNSAPEKLFKVKFTDQHSVINRFTITINSYSKAFPGETGTTVRDKVSFDVYYIEDTHKDVSSLSTNNVDITGSNPLTFIWSSPDCYHWAPSYQFQLLRLYNTSSSSPFVSDSTKIQATVDWNDAINIHVDNGDTALTLTLAQGTGWYTWRVRPVGNKYGGFGDSRDWGEWSTSIAQGATVNTNTISYDADEVFFYTQFDQYRNWIYSRVVTEGARISENMQYANGLQQVRQSQAHLQSSGDILMSQTLQDFAGRTALTTLPVPVTKTGFAYQDTLIKHSTHLYTAEDFDANSNYDDPLSMDGGYLYRYYSDANPVSNIPDAEGYPFARALFAKDGTSRVVEQSGAGATHRIKSTGTDRTIKTMYSGTSDIELIKMFGDEAPAKESVHKEYTIDANKIASVNYISKEGKTIATALVLTDDTENLLDSIATNGILSIVDTVSTRTHYSDNALTSIYPVAFTMETEVTLDYGISSKEIENICNTYCASCDYYVQFLIHDPQNDTTYDKGSHLLNDLECGSAHNWSTSITTTLAAGSYFIEKRVFSNNLKIEGGEDSTAAKTYLQYHLDSLQNQLKVAINTDLEDIYTFLNNNDIEGLYSELGVNINIANRDSIFLDSTITVYVGCDSIQIPILFCHADTCSMEFEQYFEDYWKDSLAVTGTDGDGFLKYFPNTNGLGVEPGQFDSLIVHMIADGYDCDSLWQCWRASTQRYAWVLGYMDTAAAAGTKFDLLHDFLNCTGRMYEGRSTTAVGDTGYITNAHKYFNYAFGQNTM